MADKHEDKGSKIKAYLKEMAIQTLSGGSAGFVEVCIMHPLDLVKTRLQIQSKLSKSAAADSKQYTGVIDCFTKMYRSEGVLAFYKGILPPILAETPKRAIKFLTFEQYKKLFMFGQPTPTALTFSLSGFCAGFTEAVFVNPFEVVKVTLQSNKELASRSPSTWSVTREIVKADGIGFNGLNKGLTATILRNSTFNCIYLGLYFSSRGFLPEFQDPLHEFLKKVLVGFTSGTLGSVANIPFDVAKSRIQGPQPVPGQIKYKYTFKTMGIVYREEGWRALYKGLLPKVLRLGPGGAIMLIVYEYSHKYFTALFS